MPNAVLRVDPWRHRLHRLHRMYGLSCLHCRLHLSCLHQTPWYLQSAFETLGRSRKVVWLFHTVPTSDIRNCIRNCYLEAACLPPRWKAELTRWYATNFRHHHLYLRLFWDFPQMHFKFFCKVLELHITGHHAPCQERSIEMLEIWRITIIESWQGLSLAMIPGMLMKLFHVHRACSAMNVFTTLKAWRTCFTWDPIWDWLVILCMPNVLI